jgi:multidrug resistance efflux pump
MVRKQNIELHNEEVREIMQEIPGSLIRWGLTIIFLVFASIIAGSYFFKFKEIVSAPLVITTSSPPAPIIAKTSGRITRWFVADGQKVKVGNVIALIDNPASLEDFYKVEELVFLLDTLNYREHFKRINLPAKPVLGELQDTYNRFYRKWQDYTDYLQNNFLPRKTELLRQQMEKQEEHYRLSLEQKRMLEMELEISRNGLERYKSILDKGGVSESQIDDARARVIQAERGYTNFLASLQSTEINLLAQKRTLLDLDEQRHKEAGQLELDLAENLRNLKNRMREWRSSYLLESPVDGRVTFTRYWSENHVVSAGERLATVVPPDNSLIICRAIVPSSGIGKVEPGQQVNVKLAGFPSMQHGTLSGKVSSISLVPEQEGYIVEIGLEKGMLSSYSEQLKLVQEMEGTADIVTNEMRLIYRLIKPLRSLSKT